MSRIRFPDMRLQVITALKSLSDPQHQRLRWGRFEEGVTYYDDLTLNVHILYDDCMVLPHPQAAVPGVLHEAEVPAFLELERALGPMIQDLGDKPDKTYITDRRWTSVLNAAQGALLAMQRLDEPSR